MRRPDQFDIIAAAETLGWVGNVDTEPLPETVAKAQAFIDDWQKKNPGKRWPILSDYRPSER